MNSINGQLFLSFTANIEGMCIVLRCSCWWLLLFPLLNCDLCLHAEKLDLCIQDTFFARSLSRTHTHILTRSPKHICASECVYKANEKLSHEVYTRCSLSFCSPSIHISGFFFTPYLSHTRSLAFPMCIWSVCECECVCVPGEKDLCLQ